MAGYVRDEMADAEIEEQKALYGPLAAEGPETFRGWTVADIQRLEALLEGMTAVTDAHRERL